jgi:CDP-glycerol glycerophosphotransferase (TagB/SpsB family)
MVTTVQRSRLGRAAVDRFGLDTVMLPYRIAQLPLRLLVKSVVSRLPRDPSLLVFGAATNRFADNSAYLFLYLSQTSSSLRCVWVTDSQDLVGRLRERGYEAELRWSAAGLAVCARAGWFVVGEYVSDINRWLHDGARLFNLWHGIPLKAIERDISVGRFSFMFRQRWPWSLLFAVNADERRCPDVMLSTSEFVSRRCFSSAFGIGVERCLDVGYPRNDHFFAQPSAPPSDLLVGDRAVWERLRAADFVVGYFPTWRDEARFALPGGLSLDRLASVVSVRGGLLLFKAHFEVADNVAQSPAMVVLDRADDLSAYLPLCSALITDYSSVAFDFMLLDRPIFYYVPDLEQYRSERGLYFSPDEMMPGPHLESADELYEAVAGLRLGQGPDPRVPELRARLWNGYRGDAAARIQSFLEHDEAVARRRRGQAVTPAGPDTSGARRHVGLSSRT